MIQHLESFPCDQEETELQNPKDENVQEKPANKPIQSDRPAAGR
jgi:hypothetical protein